MRNMLLAPLVALSMAGCATTSQTSNTLLTAKRSFAIAQLTFETLQQTARAAVQTGALKGSAKSSVIDAIDMGTKAEMAGHTAIIAANVTDITSANAALLSATDTLRSLGVGSN